MFYSLQALQTPEAPPAEVAFPQWPAAFSGEIAPLPAQSWQLQVEGLVAEPGAITFEALLKLPQTTREQRLFFADGWSFSAVWQGVLFSDLIQKFAPRPEARFVHQHNAAGLSECIGLQDLLAGQSMLCHTANGVSLPESHGGPVRLLVFNRYAHKGLTQVTRLSFEADPQPGFWASTQGYDPEGRIQPGAYYACDLQKMMSI